MLLHRLLTAALLIPFVIWFCLYFSTPLFEAVVALIIALAAWEWSNLSGRLTPMRRSLYVISTLVIYLLSYELTKFNWFLYTLLITANLGWILAFINLLRYEKTPQRKLLNPLISSLIGWGVLIPAGVGIVTLHAHSHSPQLWQLYLLILIWTADSGAYFVGKQWGKHPLAPNISPKKTWEGVFGGLLLSNLFIISYGLYLGNTLKGMMTWLLLSNLTLVASVIGDLFESLMKRHSDLKDSGQLLPGHGGILDRIDSLTAAIPVFTLGILLT